MTGYIFISCLYYRQNIIELLKKDKKSKYYPVAQMTLFIHNIDEAEDNVLFQRSRLGQYAKNDVNIFDKVNSDGKPHTAIKNCEYMEELNKDGQASQKNPMTKVYKIVDGLKEYLE